MGMPPDSIVKAQGVPAQWFAQALNIPINEILVCNPAHGDELPKQSEFAVAIITGSWSMVTDKLDWSERTAQWARQLIKDDKPLLGVCYGHQIMAHAMGGVVDYNPNGKEQGTFAINLNQDGLKDDLLGQMPKEFMVHLSHSQSVMQAPAGATVLAFNQHDANQIIRYGKNTISFQFHPEFTVDILRSCMASLKPNAIGSFSNPNDMPATPLALDLMKKFVLQHLNAFNLSN